MEMVPLLGVPFISSSQKFRIENFDLENRERFGRIVTVDDNKMETLVKK